MPSRPSRYGIVASRFNKELTQGLVQGALDLLASKHISKKLIDVMWVPGAFELPVAASAMARSRKYQAIIAVGCILAGETPQFRSLSDAALTGLATAAVLTGVPITCGVVTATRYSHAKERTHGQLNRGREAAEAALEMAGLLKTRRR